MAFLQELLASRDPRMRSMFDPPQEQGYQPGRFLMDLIANQPQEVAPRFGPAAMPQGGGGGLLELLNEGDHLHAAANDILPILQWADQIPGVYIREHPAFDPVDPVHTDDSWHYENKAGDINWRPEQGSPFSSEAEAINWIMSQIQNKWG